MFYISPLQIAILKENSEIVQLLLKNKNIDVNSIRILKD